MAVTADIDWLVPRRPPGRAVLSFDHLFKGGRGGQTDLWVGDACKSEGLPQGDCNAAWELQQTVRLYPKTKGCDRYAAVQHNRATGTQQGDCNAAGRLQHNRATAPQQGDRARPCTQGRHGGGAGTDCAPKGGQSNRATATRQGNLNPAGRLRRTQGVCTGPCTQGRPFRPDVHRIKGKGHWQRLTRIACAWRWCSPLALTRMGVRRRHWQ